MTNDDGSDIQTSEFPPRLAEAFRMLRTGRHICRDDGAVYAELQAREDDYKRITEALGYTLHQHSKGFFYIEGMRTTSSKTLHRLVACMLLLFLDLEERKFLDRQAHWVDSLTLRDFPVSDIVHRLFEVSADRRAMLDRLDITPQNVRSTVLNFLESFGFVSIERDNLRFRPPVYRFVDLFLVTEQDAHRWTEDGNEMISSDGEASFDAEGKA